MTYNVLGGTLNLAQSNLMKTLQDNSHRLSGWDGRGSVNKPAIAGDGWM